jgi:hypothetical protein
MANEYNHKSGHPGGHINPVTVVSEVTFSSGTATVTAASLGLKFILNFHPSIWGITTAHIASVAATTSYATNGVTSVTLECHEAVPADASASDLNVTIPITFYGTK